MGAMSRRKGAHGERELAALLSDTFGEKITRRLGQARDSGHDIDLPPFRIEVKRRARIAGLYEWMDQAEGFNPAGHQVKPLAEIPVVALRADGKAWLIVLTLTDFCKLAREEIANGTADRV